MILYWSHPLYTDDSLKFCSILYHLDYDSFMCSTIRVVTLILEILQKTCYLFYTSAELVIVFAFHILREASDMEI